MMTSIVALMFFLAGEAPAEQLPPPREVPKAEAVKPTAVIVAPACATGSCTVTQTMRTSTTTTVSESVSEGGSRREIRKARRAARRAKRWDC